MLNSEPHVYKAPPGVMCKAALLTSGWTEEDIANYLGQPDRYDNNPYGGNPVNLYHKTRVRKAETGRYRTQNPVIDEIIGSVSCASPTKTEHDNTEILHLRKEQLEQHPSNVKVKRSPQRIAGMRKNWDNDAAGVLYASFRNSFRVLDGGTRWEAAPSGTLFRVLVFYDLSEQREAELWHYWNVDRGTKSPVGRFENDLTRGIPDALAIKKLLQRNGRVVDDTSSAKTLKCIKAVRDVYKSYPEVLDSVFDLICDIGQGEVLFEALIRGMVGIERRLVHEEPRQSLNDERWRKRLLKIPYQTLKGSLMAANKNNNAEYRNAQAIFDLINKGLHQHRLIVPGLLNSSG